MGQRSGRESDAEAEQKMRASVRRLNREIERMRVLETEQVKATREAGEAGHLQQCRERALALAATRRFVQQLEGCRERVRRLGMHLSTTRSLSEQVEIMESVSQSMVGVGGQLDVEQVRALVGQFQASAVRMQTLHDAVGSSIEDAEVGDGSLEEESEAMVAAILDELNIGLRANLPEVPLQRPRERRDLEAVPAAAAALDHSAQGGAAAAAP